MAAPRSHVIYCIRKADTGPEWAFLTRLLQSPPCRTEIGLVSCLTPAAQGAPGSPQERGALSLFVLTQNAKAFCVSTRKDLVGTWRWAFNCPYAKKLTLE